MPKVVHEIERAPDATGLDLAFFCPACQEGHGISPACQEGHGISRREPGPVWTWNGDFEKPTIKPSIRVSGYRMNAEGLAMLERGESPPAGQKFPGAEYCCHTTITDGVITFCGDCTHAMAGQSVPLEEF